MCIYADCTVHEKVVLPYGDTPKVFLRSGFTLMKLFIMFCISNCSTISLCTCMSVRCVSLFWDIQVLNQVLRLSEEKVLSEEATDMGRHMQSLISFSEATSCTTSCTVFKGAVSLS